MSVGRWSLAVFVALWTTTAQSADLKGLDRKISKEPEYQSRPHYVLLVFGPKAEQQAWLVLDDEVLYIDRNGDGDLTEPDERVPLDVEATKKINVAPGTYKGMNVFQVGTVAGVRLEFRHWVRNREFVPKDDFYKKILKERDENNWENGTLRRTAKDGMHAQNPVLLCRRPEDAQISHLNGPLTLQLRRGERQKLERDGENVFDVSIGTPGLPTRNSPYPVFSPLTTSEVPADVHPVARFEFPNKTPGKPPIKLKVILNERC